MSIIQRLFGEKKPIVGNKSLVHMSRFVRGTIAAYGVPQVRKQVIKGIEDDCRRVTKNLTKKKGADITLDDIMNSKLIQDALNTPEYMDMLKELGMNSTHIEVSARGAWLEAKAKARTEVKA